MPDRWDSNVEAVSPCSFTHLDRPIYGIFLRFLSICQDKIDLVTFALRRIACGLTGQEAKLSFDMNLAAMRWSYSM